MRQFVRPIPLLLVEEIGTELNFLPLQPVPHNTHRGIQVAYRGIFVVKRLGSLRLSALRRNKPDVPAALRAGAGGSALLMWVCPNTKAARAARFICIRTGQSAKSISVRTLTNFRLVETARAPGGCSHVTISVCHVVKTN